MRFREVWARRPERWYRDVWLLVICGFLVWTAIRIDDQVDRVVGQQQQITAIQARASRESRERRDENCISFERFEANAQRAAKDAKRRVTATVAYLRSLPPEEAGTVLNKTVRLQLPQARREAARAKREARLTKAPSYCNAKGIGLPERRRVR